MKSLSIEPLSSRHDDLNRQLSEFIASEEGSFHVIVDQQLRVLCLSTVTSQRCNDNLGGLGLLSHSEEDSQACP